MKINYLIVIRDIVCVVCWTTIAIVFNEWKIALLGLLCLSSFKTRYYRVCDRCGKHSPYASTHNDAIKRAKDAGWIIRKDGDKYDDRCPDCKNKESEV